MRSGRVIRLSTCTKLPTQQGQLPSTPNKRWWKEIAPKHHPTNAICTFLYLFSLSFPRCPANCFFIAALYHDNLAPFFYYYLSSKSREHADKQADRWSREPRLTKQKRLVELLTVWTIMSFEEGYFALSRCRNLQFVCSQSLHNSSGQAQTPLTGQVMRRPSAALKRSARGRRQRAE